MNECDRSQAANLVDRGPQNLDTKKEKNIRENHKKKLKNSNKKNSICYKKKLSILFSLFVTKKESNLNFRNTQTLKTQILEIVK